MHHDWEFNSCFSRYYGCQHTPISNKYLWKTVFKETSCLSMICCEANFLESKKLTTVVVWWVLCLTPLQQMKLKVKKEEGLQDAPICVYETKYNSFCLFLRIACMCGETKHAALTVLSEPSHHHHVSSWGCKCPQMALLNKAPLSGLATRASAANHLTGSLTLQLSQQVPSLCRCDTQPDTKNRDELGKALSPCYFRLQTLFSPL